MRFLAPPSYNLSHCEYLLMTHYDEVVLNRARLYHDRRDFYIQYGDTGMRDDYPGPPYWMKQNDTDATGE
jgi:hypothetical protein